MATVATRPLDSRRASTAPARSICDSSQPPKISPWGLVSRGIARVCRVSSPAGLPGLLIALKIMSSIEKQFRQPGDQPGPQCEYGEQEQLDGDEWQHALV